MATSPQDQKQSEDDFASAYNEDMPPKAEPTEDEAFGIKPEAPAAGEGSMAEEAAETPAMQAAEGPAGEAAEAPAVMIVADAAAGGEPAGQTNMEATGDSDVLVKDQAPRDAGEGGVPIDMAAPGEAAVKAEAPVEVQAQTTGADGSPKAPMSEQSLRSWEGRLRKMQSDLEAKAAATGEKPADVAAEALEQVSDKAEGTNPQMASAVGELADKVESGEMTPEQAMKQASEDFGDDFVKMIKVIVSHVAGERATQVAGEKVGEVGQAVQDIVAHINDSQAKAHFEQILSAHPDFEDIGKSEGFRQYIDALPEADKAEAERIANGGSAKEINKLLSTYKAAQAGEGQNTAAAEAPAADPVVTAQMDAAEGVRSTGMALPEAPAKAADGYEEAWKEFA